LASGLIDQWYRKSPSPDEFRLRDFFMRTQKRFFHDTQSPAMRFLPGPLFAVAAVVALAADPPFAQLSNLTATAILGWYAWHTATKTIPQMMESFRRELATERIQHRTDRDAFLHEMTEQRVQRHDDTAAIVVAVNELTTFIKFSNKPIAADTPIDD
jgi:hypothetical protein